MSLRKEKSLRADISIVSKPFQLLATVVWPWQHDKTKKSGKPSRHSNYKPKRKQLRILISFKYFDDMYMCLQLPSDQYIHERHRNQSIIGTKVLDSQKEKDQFDNQVDQGQCDYGKVQGLFLNVDQKSRILVRYFEGVIEEVDVGHEIEVFDFFVFDALFKILIFHVGESIVGGIGLVDAIVEEDFDHHLTLIVIVLVEIKLDVLILIDYGPTAMTFSESQPCLFVDGGLVGFQEPLSFKQLGVDGEGEQEEEQFSHKYSIQS